MVLYFLMECFMKRPCTLRTHAGSLTCPFVVHEAKMKRLSTRGFHSSQTITTARFSCVLFLVISLSFRPFQPLELDRDPSFPLFSRGIAIEHLQTANKVFWVCSETRNPNNSFPRPVSYHTCLFRPGAPYLGLSTCIRLSS